MYLLYEFGIVMTRVLVKDRDEDEESSDVDVEPKQSK
jgi:Sec-independent protein secretion pathway component TatC